jgi:hypothetical protein
MGVSPMHAVGPENRIPFSGWIGATANQLDSPFQSTRMGETPMPRSETRFLTRLLSDRSRGCYHPAGYRYVVHRSRQTLSLEHVR